MSNAERILAEVDKHLSHPVSLVLYGRAALALGFTNPPPNAKHSLDVDVIIPVSQIRAFQADTNFWDAQEAANSALEKEGLYITHLFQADQVFLRRNWEKHLIPIARPSTRCLRLFRPATIDLILTKMMRGNDEEDMNDVAFLIESDGITPGQIEEAFAEVVIPDLQELRDAFERAKPRVRELASRKRRP